MTDTKKKAAPAKKAAPKKKESAATRYPWSKWTNGKQHTILKGVDYSVATEVMRGQLYVRARTDKVFVTSSVKDESVTFTFLKTKPAAAKKPAKKAPAKKATVAKKAKA